MRRLRRRITLICAGCPEGQSRMTVFRRELPPSNSASPRSPRSRCRIVAARALQSCLARPAFQSPVRKLHPESALGVSRDPGLAIQLNHGRPKKADELARDDDHRHRRVLAPANQVAIAAVEAVLRLPGLSQDRLGLAETPLGQSPTDPRRMPIVPSRLDKHPARVAITGLRNTSASLPLPGGVLARDQAQMGHELPRAVKPLKVADLHQQDESRQRGDPPEAAQPPHWLSIRL